MVLGAKEVDILPLSLRLKSPKILLIYSSTYISRTIVHRRF